MEKNTDSVIVKIISAAALLAALAIMLMLLIRGNLLSQVVANINGTKEGYEAASIYDVYYYTGWNRIYGVLYSVALFATVLAPVALMLRFNGAALLAYCGAVTDGILAILVVLVKVLAKNEWIHRMWAKIYLGEIGQISEYGDYLGVVPLVCAIIMLVLAMAVLVVLKAGQLNKIKLYNNDGPRMIVRMIIPVLYGSLVLETIRPILTDVFSQKAGGTIDVVNTFVNYFFEGEKAWGFNIPYVWFVILIALAVVVANRYLKSFKSGVTLVIIGGVAALYVVRCVVYVMNPPRLFGYLTLDEMVCDATELAYPIYMCVLVTDVLLCMLLAVICTKKELTMRALFIVTGIHGIVSLIAACLVSKGVAASYGIMLVANALALISCFYVAYIRGRHH